MRTLSHHTVALLVVAMLLGIASSAARAEDSPGKTSDKTTSTHRKTVKQLKGRLPAYFRTVVKDEQRQEIYAIQLEYDPQISKLREQLKALVDERNAKIDAVLTPEQRKKIADLKETARQRHRKAKEQAAEPKPVTE